MKPAKLLAVSLAAMFVAIGVPTGAQVLGPVVVTDPTAEPTWIQTLVQGISTATSLKNIVTMELQNVLPTAAGWAADTHNPQALMVPIFATGARELAGYQAQVAANTGAPPAPNQAVTMAQTGMAQIPTDEADLANAQAASDECTGNLCAQQVDHRFQRMQITNTIEQRQFEYTAYQQTATDQEAAVAWMTTPQTEGAQ
jgi:hypothetical protein